MLGEKGVYEPQIGNDRPTTAQVKDALTRGIREKLFMNKKAVNKAFDNFDRDHGGILSFREFKEGAPSLTDGD